MQATPSKRSAAWNAVFRLLAGLGILISLLGIGIDALPGSYPGLSLPPPLRMMDMARGRARNRWDRGVDITREYLLAPMQSYENALVMMAELEIPYLNPSHTLDIRDYMLGVDVHWNSVGHQKVGNMLSACLAVFQISGDLSGCEQVEMPSGKAEA